MAAKNKSPRLVARANHGNGLPEEMARPLTLQLISAMFYLHSTMIAHRDVRGRAH